MTTMSVPTASEEDDRPVLGHGCVPAAALQHPPVGRDEHLPVVRAHVLGVPRDALRRRHGRDRRRLRAGVGGDRSRLRHLRRPPPQARRHDAGHADHGGLLHPRHRRSSSPSTPSDLLQLDQPLVLGRWWPPRSAGPSPARCAASPCRPASRCSCRRTGATAPTAWSARSPACRSPSRRCSAASRSASSGWAGRSTDRWRSPSACLLHLQTIHIEEPEPERAGETRSDGGRARRHRGDQGSAGPGDADRAGRLQQPPHRRVHGAHGRLRPGARVGGDVGPSVRASSASP